MLEELLQAQRYVLYIGTPCQVAGLKSFLTRAYENLLTIDLVCRNVPSPALWKQYLQWQEARHKSKISSIACRKKHMDIIAERWKFNLPTEESIGEVIE